MIIINDMGFPTIESIEELVKSLKDMAYKDEYVTVSEIYHDFLIECFEADQKLQQMVTNRLGDRYICFVLLPLQDYEDLESFSFQLAAEDDAPIRRRDERVFKGLCNTCFKEIKPFWTRLLERYEKMLEP